MTGEPAIYVKTTAESGNPRANAFCPKCGSQLYSTTPGDGPQASYMLRVGILRQRELTRVAGQLSGELGLNYAELRSGERVEGIYRRSIELASGRFAVIAKSREFTLVPWRPALERALGKEVSGIARGNGISWTIGRQRSGPTI